MAQRVEGEAMETPVDDQAARGGLAEMFVAADQAIERKRTDNIFKQLDERSLTEAEERIIQQRIDMQRKMFEEYEKREDARKVRELLSMCPELNDAAALRALQLCNGREDDAAVRLTEEPHFKRRVMADAGMAVAAPVRATAALRSARADGREQQPRPRLISPSKLEGGGVFVGRFRSKLGKYAGGGGGGGGGAAAQAGTTSGGAARAARDGGAAQPAAGAEEEEEEAVVDEVEEEPLHEEEEMEEVEEASAEEEEAEELEHEDAGAAAATPSSAGKRARADDGGAAASPAAAKPLSGSAQKRRRQQQRRADGGDSSGGDGGIALPISRRTVTLVARQLAGMGLPDALDRLAEIEARHPGGAAACLEALREGSGGAARSEQLATAWEVVQAAAAADEDERVTQEAAAAPPPATARRAPAAPAAKQQQQQPEAPASSGPSATTATDGDAAVAPPASAKRARSPVGRSATAAAETVAGSDSDEEGPSEAAAAAPAPRASSSPASSDDFAPPPASHGGGKGGRGKGGKRARGSAPPPAVDTSGGRDQGGGAASGAAVSDATTQTAPAPLAAAAVATATSRPQRAAAAGASAAASAAVAAAATSDAAAGSSRAISATGHTCRGRVRQKGSKRADLVDLGSLVALPGWYNAGYIFPDGFRSRLLFRSSVDLDALCVHECEVLGEGGAFWPAPTFRVVARDRPDEPLVARSCTGCWTGILKRINAVIEQRRAAGEDLPPPPRTAIAGPEYFGFNDPTTVAAIEALDAERRCTSYWAGKQDRAAAIAGRPPPPRPPPAEQSAPRAAAAAAAPTAGGGAGGGARRAARGGKRGSGGRGGGGYSAARGEEEEDEEDAEGAAYAGTRWSSISRRDRYRKRCADAGEEAPQADADDAALLLPGMIDPVTLEPVVNPAISPFGHVMGLATWRAVLSEAPRCPFTKQPLRPDQLVVLNANNIERHRDRIISAA